MDLVALEGSSVGVDARELDIFAEVVSAVEAEEAVSAGHTRLNGNAVARLEVGDALAASNHNTSSLMSNDAVTLENERTDASRLPEVNIGTTTAKLVYFLQKKKKTRNRAAYPQMPVALT